MRHKAIATKRSQPQTIADKASSIQPDDPWAHLANSKDADSIKRIVLEADSLDAAKYDLKEICQGITSNQMYDTADLVSRTIRPWCC